MTKKERQTVIQILDNFKGTGPETCVDEATSALTKMLNEDEGEIQPLIEGLEKLMKMREAEIKAIDDPLTVENDPILSEFDFKFCVPV